MIGSSLWKFIFVVTDSTGFIKVNKKQEIRKIFIVIKKLEITKYF